MMKDKDVPGTGKRWTLKLASVIFTGLLLLISNSLSGSFWYLLWIAPVPILLLSLRVSGRTALLAAFAAGVIGRLGWLSYLSVVALPAMAAIITLLLALAFAVSVYLSRMLFLRYPPAAGVFAFPVISTAIEFLILSFSYDGSAGSMAYSQSDFIPLIQIASVTGLAGITFIVTLVPSIIVTVIHYRCRHPREYAPVGIPVFLVFIVLLWGGLRVSKGYSNENIGAGLVVLDEKLHSVTSGPVEEHEAGRALMYAREASRLAVRGIKVVLLPERAFCLNDSICDKVTGILRNTADSLNILIVAGYGSFGSERSLNCALVADTNGLSAADYVKVHLVKGLEHQFTAGTKPGYFPINGGVAGLAICKDLDYPGYIREYGRSGISVMFVPAWDFGSDGWLHSRMAIIRSVENGFPMVRAARLGRLTINDCYGRVLAESDCSKGQGERLSGSVPLHTCRTFYSMTGDWFPLVNVLALLLLSGFTLFRSLNKTKP